MYTQIAWAQLKQYLKPLWRYRPNQRLALAGGSLLMAVMIIFGATFFDDVIGIISVRQRVYVESEDGSQKLPDFGKKFLWIDDKLAKLSKSVNVIYFWNQSCVSCQEVIERVNLWQHRYKAYGVKVVSVYVPRYEFETELADVKRQIINNKITGKVGIDINYDFEDAAANASATFASGKETGILLVDGERKIRHVDIDAQNLYTTELVIQGLIEEHNNNRNFTFPNPIGKRNDGRVITNSLFFGDYEQTNQLKAGGKISEDKQTFSAAETIAQNQWTVNGTWSKGLNYLNSVSDGTFISRFSGREVYIVAQTKDGRSDFFGAKVTDAEGNEISAAPKQLDKDNLGRLATPGIYKVAEVKENLKNARLVLTLPDGAVLYQLMVFAKK